MPRTKHDYCPFCLLQEVHCKNKCAPDVVTCKCGLRAHKDFLQFHYHKQLGTCTFCHRDTIHLVNGRSTITSFNDHFIHNDPWCAVNACRVLAEQQSLVPVYGCTLTSLKHVSLKHVSLKHVPHYYRPAFKTFIGTDHTLINALYTPSWAATLIYCYNHKTTDNNICNIVKKISTLPEIQETFSYLYTHFKSYLLHTSVHTDTYWDSSYTPDRFVEQIQKDVNSIIKGV